MKAVPAISERGKCWLSLVPVLACFAAAIWQMRYDWTYDETYHYGWWVPPLMAYLISVRWRDRPRPDAAKPACGFPIGWTVIALLLPLIWLVREANPEWRLVAVALAGLAVAAGCLWFRELGGRAWLRHFGGAVGYFAVGVPWPSGLEKLVASILMPANASIALEALHWMGVASIRQGNLITLATGTLGVEEACSGIRSLQATLMIAYFLGELNFLRLLPRIGLVLAGFAIALVTNAIRTVALSAVAAQSGIEATHGWHDKAGLYALGANSAFLLLIAHLLTRKPRNVAPLNTAPPKTPLSLRPLTRGPVFCGISVLLTPLLTYFWYGRNEATNDLGWQLSQPMEAPCFRSVHIDDRTSIMLRYSAGWSAKWCAPQGNLIHGFYFEWKPGDIPAGNMNVHTPGNCLKAMGMEMVSEAAPMVVHHAGREITVQLFRFRDGDRPLFVAYLVNGAQTKETATEVGPFDFSYSRRFKAVFAGRRNSGQQAIEIGLWDENSEDSARALLGTFLEEHVKWK